MAPEQHERIELELARLREGGQAARIVEGSQSCVLYERVPTAGEPAVTDVLVPVPPGYPAGAIDLAGLPNGSPLQARVAGGLNVQGAVQADGRGWSLASYHPHQNGGGPPWDQRKHGFHTYFDHLLSWLAKLG